MAPSAPVQCVAPLIDQALGDLFVQPALQHPAVPVEALDEVIVRAEIEQQPLCQLLADEATGQQARHREPDQRGRGQAGPEREAPGAQGLRIGPESLPGLRIKGL